MEVSYGSLMVDIGDVATHLYLVKSGSLKVKESYLEEEKESEEKKPPGLRHGPRRRRRSIALIGVGDAYDEAGKGSKDKDGKSKRRHQYEVRADSGGVKVYRIDIALLEKVLGKVHRPDFASKGPHKPVRRDDGIPAVEGNVTNLRMRHRSQLHEELENFERDVKQKLFELPEDKPEAGEYLGWDGGYRVDSDIERVIEHDFGGEKEEVGPSRVRVRVRVKKEEVGPAPLVGPDVTLTLIGGWTCATCRA